MTLRNFFVFFRLLSSNAIPKKNKHSSCWGSCCDTCTVTYTHTPAMVLPCSSFGERCKSTGWYSSDVTSYYAWQQTYVPSVERLQYVLKRILLVVSQSNQCIVPNFPWEWSGYWIAKRRQDVYAQDQITCFQSSFVWVKDNTTNGLLPEQSWESTVWGWNQPDCFIINGLPETCCEIAMFQGYTVDDDTCWNPRCLICQMYANWGSWPLSLVERATRFCQNHLLRSQVLCLHHRLSSAPIIIRPTTIDGKRKW
jgi:hypothetical protein